MLSANVFENGCKRWSSAWGAATHLGDLDKAPGSWIQPGKSPVHCGHLRNEPAEGRSIPLLLSLLLCIKIIRINPLKHKNKYAEVEELKAQRHCKHTVYVYPGVTHSQWGECWVKKLTE